MKHFVENREVFFFLPRILARVSDSDRPHARSRQSRGDATLMPAMAAK